MPRELARVVRRSALLDIVSLLTSLLGLVGLAYVIWRYKAGESGPPRIVYLGFLAMACAPFYVTLVQTPKMPFLIPPIVAIFLLYPIANPHGVVYSPDPVFNFSFTDFVLTSGFWTPGQGNAFARAYSFYPIGNVFIGYVISTVAVPPEQAYLWVEPVIRLLALPAAVYSIGRRLLNARVAMLGLLFYLGTPSILFNLPVQQGMGVIFLSLSLLALTILNQAGPTSPLRVRILFGLVSGALVMTHHFSSYVFAAWLGAVVILLFHPASRPFVARLRLGLLFLYFVGVLLVYILAFTYPIFQIQEQTIQGAAARLLFPDETPGPQSPAVGRTFATYEVAWLTGTVLGLFLLAFVSLRRYRVVREYSFAVANCIVASALTFVTLPLIVTQVNYIPLRITEYTNLVVAPFAAATLIRWSRTTPPWLARLVPSIMRPRRWVAPGMALVISAALLMGGNLAPLTMRMYFESNKERSTDSPIFLGSDAIRAGDWAETRFGDSRVWGDQLTVDTFSGFGNMRVDFGSSRVFNHTTMDAETWLRLCVGDYVVVDHLMVVYRPNFLHEPVLPQPLNLSQVEKFRSDPHLALVYEDASFSVYRVMSRPPGPRCIGG
jgi:hypothetical protein